MKQLSAFISYSHADKAAAERLLVHLKPLERKYRFVAWSDARISAGSRWREAIAEQMDRASIVVLFVSADFLASDFIMKEEYPKALAKAESDGTKLVIICASPCDTHALELIDYQMINTMDNTLQHNQNNNEAEYEQIFSNATIFIRETLEAAALNLDSATEVSS